MLRKMDLISILHLNLKDVYKRQAYMTSGDVAMQYKAVLAPMLIAAVGILLSIIGIFSVRTKEDASIKSLLNALSAVSYTHLLAESFPMSETSVE